MASKEQGNEEIAGKRVLVVDDEQPIRMLIKEILKKHNIETISAADRHEAIEKAEAERPDLITMDERLPATSGTEVAKRLKSSYKTRDIPVIAVTSHLSREVEQNPEAYGFCCHLDKPFDMDSLVSAVRENIKG